MRGARPTRAMCAIALLSSLAASACDAPSAVRPIADYDPTTLSGGKVYRWESGRTINVYTDHGDSLGVVDLSRAVNTAIAVWNDVPLYREYRFRTVSQPAEADLIVFDRRRELPVQPGSCGYAPGGARGYTYFCAPGSVGRAERLKLASGAASNVSVVIQVDRAQASTQTAYNAVVAHEFGHALGIGAHSSEAFDLMFGLPTVQQPSGRDIRTLRDLLGRRADIIL